ncbi:hypothetical protein, partial [Desulfobacter postgatei]|uniref:hypothetical protein n=1 Tax=Desulfobacter postgatei TaxID=2293 RepID=UPI002A370283
MKSKLNALDRSMEKYKDIQEKQINAFETELMPDLESLNFERAAVFADLKNNLDHFSNIIHYEPDMELIIHYQTRLKEIMETDERLKKRIT